MHHAGMLHECNDLGGNIYAPSSLMNTSQVSSTNASNILPNNVIESNKVTNTLDHIHTNGLASRSAMNTDSTMTRDEIGNQVSVNSASSRKNSVHVANMEKMMLQYLSQKGYRFIQTSDSETSLRIDSSRSLDKDKDVIMQNTAIKQQNAVSESKYQRNETVSDINQYTKHLGLNVEDITMNHIIFNAVEASDPFKYEECYKELMEWICNSLDVYKYELYSIAFPVYVHCFLELMAKGFVKEAREFLLGHMEDHLRLHREEIRNLCSVMNQEQIRKMEYAQRVLHSQFHIQLSLLSYQLLNAFLRQEQMFLVLLIINTRVHISVTSHHPGLQLEQLEDECASESFSCVTTSKYLESKDDCSGYKTSDELAESIVKRANPNDADIAIQLTQGPYDMSYVVNAADGYGSTVEDLHAIPVHWGVLPERKAPQDTSDVVSGEIDSSNGSKSAVTVLNAGSNVDTVDKKGILGEMHAATADDAAPQSDKSAPGNAAKMLMDTSDLQRKIKRIKLINDDKTGTNYLLEKGPIPNRRSSFHADILEKLVLREPPEMKAAGVEDLRGRVALCKSSLPSALCFTCVNTSVHATNIAFSNDVALVGACYEDSSFRVWRNDEQPLGTATGTSYQEKQNHCRDQDRRAILRGHSNTCFGASFSPDNRFVLTSSADSTVRLWSLASRSNVAVYRSHASYPVWNVEYGPYGYYFASCSMDRTARLWSTDHVTPLRIYAGHLSSVDCVKFHPNHHYLATGSSDKTVRLWDVQSGKCIRIFTGHFHGVKCVAFSKNGRYLASSGDDQYINIWDLQAGKRLQTLVGHHDSVNSLSFSFESTILASGGMDSTIRLWDMQTLVGKSFCPFPTHDPSDIAKTAGSEDRQQIVQAYKSNSNHIIRPGAMKNLPLSPFLLRTLRTKQTPIYTLQFTRRNLLLCGGFYETEEM